MFSLKIILFTVFVTLAKCDNNSLIDEILTINKCEQEIHENEFILESPNYPEKYPNNLNCHYKIKNVNLKCPLVLEVYFIDFSLESSLGCMKDRLEIDYTDALCGLMRDKKSKTYNFGNKSEAILNFHTDESNTERGFKLMIRKINCNRNMTAIRRSSQCALNPGYPPTTCGNYPQYPTNPTFPQFPTYPIAPVYPTYPQYPTYPMTPTNPTYPQNPTYPITPTYPPQYPQLLPQCCSNAYNRQHFYLSSPEFPNSQTAPTDCIFQIYRTNQNICQLRIFVKFAWIGEDTGTGCPRGFFEIDGRRYCGCKTGITVYSRFNNLDNTPITIRYRNEGYPRTMFNGITFEIFQETCGSIRRTNRDTSKIFANKLETFDETDMPRVNSNNASTLNDRNFNTFSPFNSVAHTVNEIICRKFSLVEWLAIQALDIFQQTGRCVTGSPPTNWPQYPINPVSPSNCQVFNGLTGVIQSPGYPSSYQRGLNLCYRFYRQNNYCGFRINIGDFDIESSPNCQKAGMILYQKGKFCGQALKNSVVVMDLTNKQYEDIYFITDLSPSQCGRGFYGTYQQIQCNAYPSLPTYPTVPINPTPPCQTDVCPSNPTYPTYPTYPTFPTYPTNPSYPTFPTYPNNPSSSTKCGQEFRGEYFTITAKGANEPLLTPPFCDYHVIRSNQNICQVYISFLRFDLECRYEFLLINNQEYCGPHLSGKTVSVPFTHQQAFTIVYYKKNYLSPGSSYHIQGQQSAYNCNDYSFNLDDVLVEKSVDVAAVTQNITVNN